MSIQDEIEARIREGRLVRIMPTRNHIPSRWIYVAKEIHDELNAKLQTLDGARIAILIADLELFADSSNVITVSNKAFTDKRQTCYLKLLTPDRDQSWEIRSCDLPQYRIFGKFSDPDSFVALEWSRRDDLGNGPTREWKSAASRAGAKWRNLFPAYDPFKGVHLRDYVSNSIEI